MSCRAVNGLRKFGQGARAIRLCDFSTYSLFCDARGWEGYHLSNATKAIWRALDNFDEMDESDKEALGDGFLDDLHTALTPIEQIANGDYFVN